MSRYTPRLLAILIGMVGFGPPSHAQSLPEVLRRTPNTTHGAELFRNCLACHGQDGLGAPDGSVPIIAGQHASVIAKQLLDYRRARRWDIRMERIADKHLLTSAQDIADVAAYASRLDRGSKTGTGDTAWIERGEAKFVEQCASCHGAAAQGNAARRIPRLAGQHYDYLLRQMYDAVDGRRPNLSSAHVKLLKGFVMEDYEGLANFLSTLPAGDPET